MVAVAEQLPEVVSRTQRSFRIRESIDADRMGRAFAADGVGHVCIPHFVNGEAARALLRELRASSSWSLRVCDGKRLLGLRPQAYAAASSAELHSYATLAYSAGQRGFAFLREELWPDNTEAPDVVAWAAEQSGAGAALAGFVSFVQGPVFMHCASRILGIQSPRLQRLAVERYRPGHFCGFTRGAPAEAQFGFCFELTPGWISEWGALLEFGNFSGGLEQVYAPHFNCMVWYRLDKSRAVSFVAPYACHERYAVVGQLRAA